MKFKVTFSRKGGREPLIARTVRDTGVLINVERARIESMAGEVLIDVPDADAELVCDTMRKAGARVETIEHSVVRDETECIDCGACISICPQDVFYFDENWCLALRQDRCVLCGKCVESCPHGALSIQQ